MTTLDLYNRNDLFESFKEYQMSRTPYQLERFVIKEHHTPEMQFVQLCRELESLYYTLMELRLNIKKGELEINILRSNNNEISFIEAEIKELHLSRSKLQLIGLEREAKVLLELYDNMPKFTRDEIDRSQEGYWQERILREAELQLVSGAPSWAHFDLLDRMGNFNTLIERQNNNLLLQNNEA